MTKIGTPLSVEMLLGQIQPLFTEVISRNRTLEPIAHEIAVLKRSQQDRVLHWLDVIARTNAELAYQLGSNASEVMRRASLPEFDAWVLQAMHTYDHHGLYAATSVLRQVDRFIEQVQRQHQTVTLKQVQRVLETFLRGLNGRRLGVEAGEQCWTDTENIYLPESIAIHEDRQQNFQLYKAYSAMLWAQTWFGTFALDNEGELRLKTLTDFDDFDSARAIFLILETERLLVAIENMLPGLGRQMRGLDRPRRLDGPWRRALTGLDRDATVDDCLNRIKGLVDEPLPEPSIFQCSLRLPNTEQTIQSRIALQRQQLEQALNELISETGAQQRAEQESRRAENPELEALQLKPVNRPDSDQGNFELAFKGTTFTPSAEVKDLLQSILQDLGEIPLDYLVAGGGADTGQPRGNNLEIPQSDEELIEGLPYPEWDYRRGNYRRDWCYLVETDIDDGPGGFVADTLDRYAAVLPQLRKSFEALRGEDRWLRRQADGDEIDIDALVDALADMHIGEELGDRLYTRLSRIDRNIAVMLMIDMSGSTKGWVNDAERESLVLLCQALEILGDQYAIYGFSGMTRKRCELFRIKQFGEPYSAAIERRISGIKARDYTRMGVTIRHLNTLLEQVPAKTKLLITLSDGKPEDFDGYGGEYGIEDTRQALLESRRLGIHPFCITIDSEASSYLPHMYGVHSYAVVDDVRTLPLRVAEVYRRLTH